MTSDTLLARIVDLDSAHLVLFAMDHADLPDADVEEELEVLETIAASGQTRGPVQDLLQDFGTNLASEAVWTGVLATFTATAAYMARRRRRAAVTLDSVEVMARVRLACREIVGTEPVDPANVRVERGPDGTWQAEVDLPTGVVSAQLDASGTMLLFRRTSSS